jgi:hypothetical protein
MSKLTFVYICFAIPLVALVLSIYLDGWIRKLSWLKRSLIKSFFYASFLGIGVIGGSDSDPGFALPGPIIPVALVTERENWAGNVAIPFCFFWTIFFLCLGMSKLFASIRKRRTATSNGKPF